VALALRAPALARAAVLALPALLLAALAASALGITRTWAVLLVLGGAGGAAAVAAGAARRALPWAVAAFLAAELVVLAAWPSVNALAVIGPHPDGGGRFYGITNEVETLVLAPVLAGAAVVSGAWLAGLSLLALVTLGWSRAGADGGGLLVYAAGYGMLLLRASGRPTPRRVLVAAAAVVAPWTARNARVYGRFVLVASEGGVTFWTGNHPLSRGEGDLAANPDLKAAELAFRRAHPGLTPEQLEPLYYRDAFQHIVANPAWWLTLLARKTLYTVIPLGPSYTLHSTKYWVASIASYLLLLPFAAAGAVRLWRSPRRPAALFVLGASAVLVCLVFFPQERFRIPVIDPVLIVCAAAVADAGRRL
jgi:hypothetical protein